MHMIHLNIRATMASEIIAMRSSQVRGLTEKHVENVLNAETHTDE
jgi:hypothetical protein